MQLRRPLSLLMAAAATCAQDPYGPPNPDAPDGCKWGTKPPCPHTLETVPDGPYKNTKVGLIKDVPGVTSVANADERGAIVTYPVGYNETYPLVVFGHGAMVAGTQIVGDGTHTLFHTVASYGFVVVAPCGCRMGAFEHDMLATADAVRNDPSLHPALATIDFSRGMGIHGHSNGGMATQRLTKSAATIKKYNIKAAVAMHGAAPPFGNYGPTGSNVPFMFAAAAGDTIAGAAGSSGGYDAAGNGPKVLWVCKGGSHFEPVDVTIPASIGGGGGAGREDQPIALFMACHVRGEHCDEVYGPSGDAICHTKQSEGQMSQCKANKGGPGPAPTPPGPTPPGPTPPAPQPSAACVAALAKDCAGDQGNDQACSLCVLRNAADLRSGGCNIQLGTHDDAWVWCHQS